MGIFGKKGIKISNPKTMLTESQFMTLLKELPEYHSLLGLVGMRAAEESLKDMYWLHTGRYKQSGYCVSDRDWNVAKEGCRKILVRQRQSAIRTEMHLRLLYGKASRNELAPLLNTPGNFMSKEDVGATDQDDQVTIAAKWIKSCSGSFKGYTHRMAEVPVGDIVAVLNRCIRENKCPFKLSTLKYLHKALVPAGTIDPRRPLNPEQPWPSSAVAKLLQHFVARQVISVCPPLLSGEEWDNWACYFLGAYTGAHGFPDGNGRPNRALYALTMINGDRPLVLPETDFTNKVLVRGENLPSLAPPPGLPPELDFL